VRYRVLGTSGVAVSALGLGCMGMSEFYGPRDEAESLRTIDRAAELGVNLLDSADMYGLGANEELLGRALRGRRERFIVSTKFGILRAGNGVVRPGQQPMGHIQGIDGRPEYVRAACEASLRRLGVDYIDLYYLARVDPQTPIEETVGAMAELVWQGKVRYLGLSEVSAATLRRADRVHPITAVSTEYSLWSRDPEDEIIGACRELDATFVAYSPLGRGFLTGTIRSESQLAPDDLRRNMPRFQGDNLLRNLGLVATLQALAAAKGCTPAQLALAWVLARGGDIIPIPGTRRRAHLEENVAALDVTLTPAELAEITAAAPTGVAAGTRYPEPMMATLNR